MSEIIKWLSANPNATIFILILVGFIFVFLITIYSVAFFQKRSISFWPPKIGALPDKKSKSKIGPDKTELINNESIFYHQVYGEPSAFFKDEDETYPDIEKEAMHSKTIRYIGAVNTTFLKERTPKETLLFRLLNRKQSNPIIKFLHLDPNSRFISIRAKELKYPKDGQEIRDGIRTSLENINLIKMMSGSSDKSIEIKYYDFNLIFRIVLLDKYAYVSFYRKGRTGRDCPILKVPENSEFYHAFDRFFESVWEYQSKIAA